LLTDVIRKGDLLIMAENQESNKTGTNGEFFEKDHVKNFREMLLSGSIVEAASYMREHELNEQIVSHNVREAYEVYKATEEYRLALRIAEEFNFAEQDVLAMKIAEWNRINREKKFEEAAEWAKKQDLSGVEIGRSAKMAYEQYIRDNKTDDALRIIDRYGLSKDELISLTIAEFNRAFGKGEYYKAAMLGMIFNFSISRTLSAAVKACLSAMENENFTMAVDIVDRFKLFSDNAIENVAQVEMEKLLKNLLENLVEPAFEKGKIQLMHEFAQKTGLINFSFQHSILKNFEKYFLRAAVQSHNRLLQNNDGKSARFVKDSFDLFSAPIPYELYSSLIESAEKYHDSILQSGELTGAVAFKNEYGLFTRFTIENSKKTAAQQAAQFIIKSLEKADILSAKRAITEYQVPKELINNAVFSAVMSLGAQRIFDKAFSVLDEFEVKISGEGDRFRVVNLFQVLMNEKQYLPAVEFAKRFHLQKSLIEKSAFKAWLNEFNEQNFDTALDIKSDFKLAKRLTLPLARKTYRKFMDSKNYILARTIRKDYGVPIGITGWIFELICILFSR